MGRFSWMFSDTYNKESLKIYGKAYVICPDGTIIFEKCYDGYGIFGGYDIFELVADWNKNNISEINMSSELQDPWGSIGGDKKWFQLASEFYKRECQKVKDFVNRKSDIYMQETYGKEWKRDVGISIAGDDESNMVLKYPIKICKNKPVEYNSLPASNCDPNQGCGDDEDDFG